MNKKILSLALLLFSPSVFAQSSTPVHGVWLWKTPSVLEQPKASERLLDFCEKKGITEVYISVPGRSNLLENSKFISLIQSLHTSHIRVEALLDSIDANEPGKHRDELLAHVQQMIHFNTTHPQTRFDGIHLDVEPHQKEEYRNNLNFLPGLIDTFVAVRDLTVKNGLTVAVDIPNKVLKSDTQSRQKLFTSVSRVFLMLYELTTPQDTLEKKTRRLKEASSKFMVMAYSGLTGPNLAKMAIALRTPDYETLLPDMLKLVDETHHDNPHYLGWARHSYNDYLDSNH